VQRYELHEHNLIMSLVYQSETSLKPVYEMCPTLIDLTCYFIIQHQILNDLQASDVSAELSWQTVSSEQNIYVGHRDVLETVARIHRAMF